MTQLLVPRLLISLLKSIMIGVIISSIILLLVPDLREGSGLPLDIFSQKEKKNKKLSFSNAVNSAGPAVVNVYSESLDSSSYYRRQPVQRTNLGSGVIMNIEGYILTCLHVIENAVTSTDNIITIGLQDGRLAEAQIVGFDPITDLAVLSISEENLTVVPQQSENVNAVGDVVLAIGNPYNLGQTVTQGIVSRISNNGLNNYFDYIQTDAVLSEGNSGGALVDSEGNLLGITNANFKTRVSRNRVEAAEGVSFAIPYSLAKKVMEQIISNGKVTRGALGFTALEQQPTGSGGILVTAVSQGGPAELGGLQVKDIVVSVDGHPTTSIRDTLNYITNIAPGSTITFDIIRGGKKRTLQMIVGELEI
ncbi:trypsin-like peptidase domain-containing protein [Paraglaciecola aquimarina]|uniref:Trypsin-like peptidase domain-containing protein n=1 Tax=Paraglaciecola aquimarina TaxID=1235557 RepID=A0ABU3SS21_9ALTE|nr:trypsin-like peptidase domain-containing protein [Paraglaciecola aquimarina]MDU0352819.1 trypsin-like peptidase domain-containing protein [Paraglaciecola aquimarina]